MKRKPSVGVVAIGRNEGARLIGCLQSLQFFDGPIVYVDSGSSDGSVAAAREFGATVVELNPDLPFTAARGRHTGYERLNQLVQNLDFVQFVDGDCSVENGWTDVAAIALAQNPELGIVTGWRNEVKPEQSIYNRLCDFEWHRPEGEILTCGGDMMVRCEAYAAAGGFDQTVIAAEDDEFCTRVRNDGWRIRRLPLDMTRHDAAMTHFSQWWSRAVRSGHGFAQVGAMHKGYFQKEKKRVWVYGAILPAVSLVFGLLFPPALALVLALYLFSFYRSAKGLNDNGLMLKESLHQAMFLSISKFPNFFGMLTFYWRRFFGVIK